MKPSELSFRYARALFLTVDDSHTRHMFGDLLFELSRALNSAEELKLFVETPLIAPEKKEETLNQVFKSLKAPEEFRDFVRLLAAKDRLNLIQEIAEAYRAKIDELDHVERGHVRSAGELSEKEKADIQAAIEKYCRKKVVLDYTQDEHMLGGMAAQVGSLTFDDSLFSHLNQIKEELTRGVLGR